MRMQDEVQAAHDRLVGILLGEVPNPFPNMAQGKLQAMTDVLCWVLRHEHNRYFEKTIEDLDKFFAERGLILRKQQ